MTTPSACRRYRVIGRVQGVFFRAATRTQALSLGLTGHAINLPDGSVEVLACGAALALDTLATWLWQGPPAASVTKVELLDASAAMPTHAGFVTG